MLYVLIVLLIISDQLSKYWITHNMSIGEVRPVIEGFFSITYFRNPGGAFSFLAEHDWGIYILAGISVLVAAVLLVILFRIRKKHLFWIRFSLALLVAGTIGNMLDRVIFKSVVDYLMFTFGTYTFPVFNLADMCIVCGSILLAILLITDKKLFLSSEEKPEDTLSKEADSKEGKYL